ncbi:scopoletin glucosyltransferase-like [Prosopis cineraria]|uniref:scopoletin glucosyltransferase-like n=1 Tax=Prosopis cineraria TaxID=364024 RepID=UPI00240ED4B8|nr:scopoletin glucosyltransferase-like [Prosopis cineraria]XP_054778864.1 scopoletin glucosyltransferase-like [Prosopis cineraria]XP_054778865.1 scopoletin glucosyltransferase-like [Prosopis cineraria]
MSSQSHDLPLHVAFFPFMSHSHMMATIDVGKLFASRGPKVTFITTPSNSPLFSKSIHKSQEKGHQITLHIIKFPSSLIGLPEGCETLNFVNPPQLKERFLKVIPLLEQPLDEFLRKHRPDLLVADTIFSWANNLAAKHGIPRLVFHGTCNFAICASLCIHSSTPHNKVSSDSEPFVIPNLPGNIEFSRNQLPSFMKLEDDETEMSKVFRASADSDSKCYGVIVNSFYELEPAYSDFYRNVLGRKIWNIGPVSLCGDDSEVKANRGNRATASNINHECLKWLDHKEPNSIIYICFGSTTMFTNEQLKEIALGLEASGMEFIWVINKSKEEDDTENEGWVPKGFENRTKEKGLILRNWAPQLLILGHRAVGAFVTHCGWNSVMEAVAAGVIMVTWPVGAEQFFNEKLVTQVLKVGVSVGVQKWVRWVGESVKHEAIERAMRNVMSGEEAEEMRIRARGFAEKAREAVAVGGSSYSDLSSLIGELLSLNS